MADKDDLAAKTIPRMIGQARAFWKCLVEHEIVPRALNIAALEALSVPKTAAKQVAISPFTPTEVGKLRPAPQPFQLRGVYSVWIVHVQQYRDVVHPCNALCFHRN
jgi:hypothetical protein